MDLKNNPLWQDLFHKESSATHVFAVCTWYLKTARVWTAGQNVQVLVLGLESLRR